LSDTTTAAPKKKSVSAYHQEKAAALSQQIQAHYAVPRALLEQLQEANYREAIEDCRLATQSLPIGTVSLGVVSAALADLKRQKVG